HVPHGDRQDDAGDRIEDDVQEDVRRRRVLWVEEAPIRDGPVDALLHGGGERAEKALPGGEETEGKEGSGRVQPAARRAELRHELVVLDLELAGEGWRPAGFRGRCRGLLHPSTGRGSRRGDLR